MNSLLKNGYTPAYDLCLTGGGYSPLYQMGYANALSGWKPQMWANTLLANVLENRGITAVTRKNFSPDIARQGETITINRPQQLEANQFNDGVDETIIQDIGSDTVDVKLDQHVEVTFVVHDMEQAKALDSVNFMSVYGFEASEALFRDMETRLLVQNYRFMSNRADKGVAGVSKNNCIGNLGSLTPASARTDLTAARRQAIRNRMPGDRWMFINEDTDAELLNNDIFIRADSTGDGGRVMMDGFMAPKLGWRLFTSQFVPNIELAETTLEANGLASDAAAGATTVTVNTAGNFTEGEYITFEGDVCPYKVTDITGSVLTLNRNLRVAVPAAASDIQIVTHALVDNAGGYALGYLKGIAWDNGPTAIERGQLVSFAGHSAEYGVVKVSGAQIFLDRPLEAAVADDEVIGLGPNGIYNYGFDPRNLTMVQRGLTTDITGGPVAATASFAGITIRVTVGYDQRRMRHIMTADVVFGVKPLEENYAVPWLA